MDKSVQKKFENENVESMWEVDWTSLPDDTVIQLFSCLNNRARASLSSTCKAWWILSKSPCLWQVLDLRFNKCDAQAANSLASRCSNLHKIRFRGDETAASMINLKANNLREISTDDCRDITDVTLINLVAQHEALECLQLGAVYCNNISSDAIKAIALCCPNLKKLWLSGMKEINEEAIHALADNCQKLTDIGFTDCEDLDEAALGSVKTLGFLSVAGTDDINWNLALIHWSNLPNLVCLDVSRTDIEPSVVSELLLSCFGLNVLCALGCPSLEHNPTLINRRGKRLVAFFTDILKELATLFIDMPKEKGNVFLDLRKPNNIKDRKLECVLDWLEGTICNSLLCFLEYYNPTGTDNFWPNQGMILLLSFLESPHVEVQETAAKALAAFVVTDGRMNIDVKRTEEAIPEDVIRFLVNLACSSQEGLQTEVVKAILNLSNYSSTAKVVVDEGGVDVLIHIAMSATKTSVKYALRGLQNLSSGCDHKSVFANMGRIRALIDIILKWSESDGYEYVMGWLVGCALAILRNLATDEKCCMEVATVGGVRALVSVLKIGVAKGVQEQNVIKIAAEALWYLGCIAENAMRIIDEDGVPWLTHICCTSVSKMVGFLSALALANMFDARLDELSMIGTSSGSTSNSAHLESARRMASEAIQAFLKSFPDLQIFSAAASSSLPASEALTHVLESVRIHDLDLYKLNGLDIERFLTMLCHSSPILISCGAFSLLQFTWPGGRQELHHLNLLQKAGAHRLFLLTEASESASPEAKAFVSIVRRNLEKYNLDYSN